MSDKLQNTRKTGLLLGGVAVLMFGFGYLLIPLYDVICDLTNQNKVGTAAEVVNSQVDESRWVTIEFDTNINRLPWQFKAEQASVKVRPGQLMQVAFEVRNEKNEAVSGQAIPSYGPAYSAQYFQKIECFCFTQQTLKAGEVKQMPVVFVIDPALPKDVNTITLSYTFFEVDGKSKNPAGAEKAAGA